MPRTAAGKKNQHNARHENGLVGPGKRIHKQRSNGQLIAAKGPIPDTPPLTPTTSIDPLRNRVANDSDPSLSDSRQDYGTGSHIQGLRERSSTSFHEQSYGKGIDGVTNRTDEDVASRPTFAGDVGTLQLASTILRSCPAYDTIAMLILLLQLPPVFLSLVQALFASLTFMPPNGALMTSVFTLFDVFQGSAGTPSLSTIIAVDTLFLAGWFCLWNWARSFAFDLAQVQIAITLGGGNAGRAGSVNSVCVAMVLLLHLVRSRSVRQFLMGQLLGSRILSSEQTAHITKYLPQGLQFGETPPAPSWYRSLFAVHIITQAGIAIIRRNVARGQVNTAKLSKRVDSEVVGALQEPSELTSVPVGSGVSDQPSAHLGSKDGRDRTMNAKKRKKLANQVRSRQPFWAALASTKVNALREIEVSRPSGPIGPAFDGNPDFASLDHDGIRISHVDSSTIKFEALNLALESREDELSTHHKPLFVRINGAYWTSTSIHPSDVENSWCGEITGLIPNCTYTCSFVHPSGHEIAAIMVKTPALVDGDPASLSSPLFHSSQRPSSPTTTIRQSIMTAEARAAEIKTRTNKSRRSHKAALTKLEREVEALNSRLKSSNDDTKQRQKLLQAERTMKQIEDATRSITTALDNLSAIPEEVDEYPARKNAFDQQVKLLTGAAESLTVTKSSTESELAGFEEELKATHRQHERAMTRQNRLIEQHERITLANTQGLNEKERKAAEILAKERDQARIEAEYSNQSHVLQRELNNLSQYTQQAKQEAQTIETQMIHAQQSQHVMDSLPASAVPNTRLVSQPYQPTSPMALPFVYPAAYPPFTPPPTHASLDPHSALPSTYASPILPHPRPHQLPTNDHHPNSRTRARSASDRSAGASAADQYIYTTTPTEYNFPPGSHGASEPRVGEEFEDADPIPPMMGRFQGQGSGVARGGGGDRDGVQERKGSGGSSGANSASPLGMGMGMGMVRGGGGGGSPGSGGW